MRLMNNIIHSGLRIPHFGDDPRSNFTCNRPLFFIRVPTVNCYIDVIIKNIYSGGHQTKNYK